MEDNNLETNNELCYVLEGRLVSRATFYRRRREINLELSNENAASNLPFQNTEIENSETVEIPSSNNYSNSEIETTESVEESNNGTHFEEESNNGINFEVESNDGTNFEGEFNDGTNFEGESNEGTNFEVGGIETLQECNDSADFKAEAIKKLQDWFKNTKCSREESNTLLGILRMFPSEVLPTLPTDVRTFINDNNDLVWSINPLPPGAYIYFGVEYGIRYLFEEKCHEIDHLLVHLRLTINVDGLPIAKSSRTAFWPILVSVQNYVFIASLFCGVEKPKNADDLLQPFVNEICKLYDSGIIINGRNYKVIIDKIICDLPAKAYILNVVGHTGYNSCSKCLVRGIRIGYRMTFAETNAAARKGEDFLNISTSNTYHHGSTILTQIPELDLVSQVIIDPMHAAYLGVTRSITRIIFGCKANCPVQRVISASDEEKINNLLQRLYSYCPSDFARKPRSIRFLADWKATEWRQWVLYVGIIVLKPYLSNDLFNHFALLNYSLRVMSKIENINKENMDYVIKLLKIYVSNTKSLFGEWLISQNFHNLIHIPTDVLKYGSLEEISAFRFENFLYQLKNALKSGNRPLEQVANKYKWLLKSHSKWKKEYSSSLKLKTSYKCKDDSRSGIQHFKGLEYKKIYINIEHLGDCFIKMKNSAILKIFYIFTSDGEVFLEGKQFSVINNYFNYPADSSLVGIYSVSDLGNELVKFKHCDIKAKLYPFQLENNVNNEFVMVELLH